MIRRKEEIFKRYTRETQKKLKKKKNDNYFRQ